MRLGTPATPELLRNMGVEEVVVATGARRAMPAIPGADRANVYSGDDMRKLMLGQDLGAIADKTGWATRAAMKAGAARVEACDIDAFAATAIGLNAEANGVAVTARLEDLLGRDEGWEGICAGDVCYEREMSARALAWLRGHADAGRLVLLGDPGRNYFSAQGLEEIARYEIPTSLQLENRGMRETVVWQVLPLRS